jgi:cation transport ATPase
VESAPKSASLCPACGKAVDPLRAGQVAIIGGSFKYFCDAKCKAAYVEAASKRPALDRVTAEPPSVVSGVRAADDEPKIVSGVREPEPVAPAFVEPEPPSIPEVAEEAASDDEAPSPTTLRSPPQKVEKVEAKEPEPETPPPSRASDRAAERVEQDGDRSAILLLAGVGAGVLAAVVSLAGEGASVARLPLALAASALLVGRAAMRTREANEVSRLVIAVPVAVAAIVATVATMRGEARAEAHAAFVGLAAAAALAAEVLLTRARRDVDAVRARSATVLAVRAKVVRGDVIHDVEAAHVKPGEQVVIESGEVVPVDGLVSAGTAEIAPWLDSPVVTEKREGDAVVAGAALVSGRLRVTATFAGSDRVWLRLTQPRAASIEVAAPLVSVARRWIERGSPIAGALVGGAAYANNASWSDVVIAACAGGAALAASGAATAAGLAHARAHAAAQRRGIVYKDASAFDVAARSDVAVVCSRGTVLLGEPEIVALEAVTAKGADAGNPREIARVLALAAGAEMARSTHPDASAVHHEARARTRRRNGGASATRTSPRSTWPPERTSRW